MGFIGTNMCGRLLDENEITVYDNETRNALQFAPWSEHRNLRRIKGDILDRDMLTEVVKGHTIILHMAAIAGVQNVVSKPFATLQVNLIGTYNLLEAIQDQPVKRFVDFSTSEVYGPNVFRADEDGMTTLGPLSKPRWVYAASKLASEYLSMSYHRERGLPVVIVRPFNVYGPYQVGGGAARNFIFRALRNQDLIVHGVGDEIRSWCFVDDFLDGLIACCENDSAIGQSFNLGNPQATCTTLALAQEVIRQTGNRSQIVFREIDYSEIQVRVPSIQKASTLIGYRPKVSLQDGIGAFIKWLRDNPKALDIIFLGELV